MDECFFSLCFGARVVNVIMYTPDAIICEILYIYIKNFATYLYQIFWTYRKMTHKLELSIVVDMYIMLWMMQYSWHQENSPPLI